MKRILTYSLLGAAIAIGGCSRESAAPADPGAFVFDGGDPLAQLSREKDFFNQAFSAFDRQLLLSYLAANKLAQIKQTQHSPIAGKTVAQVLAEAREWNKAVVVAQDKAKAISQQISQLVNVQAVDKSISQGLLEGNRVDVLSVTYRITNLSNRTIAALAGRVNFLSGDGHPAASFNHVFQVTVKPGASEDSTGSGGFRIGTSDTDPARYVARSDLRSMAMRFDPQAIVFDNGERMQIPTL